MQKKYLYFLQYRDKQNNIWINESIYEDIVVAYEKFYEALNAHDHYRLVEEIILVQSRKFLTKW